MVLENTLLKFHHMQILHYEVRQSNSQSSTHDDLPQGVSPLPSGPSKRSFLHRRYEEERAGT